MYLMKAVATFMIINPQIKKEKKCFKKISRFINQSFEFLNLILIFLMSSNSQKSINLILIYVQMGNIQITNLVLIIVINCVALKPGDEIPMTSNKQSVNYYAVLGISPKV